MYAHQANGRWLISIACKIIVFLCLVSVSLYIYPFVLLCPALAMFLIPNQPVNQAQQQYGAAQPAGINQQLQIQQQQRASAPQQQQQQQQIMMTPQQQQQMMLMQQQQQMMMQQGQQSPGCFGKATVVPVAGAPPFASAGKRCHACATGALRCCSSYGRNCL